MRRTLPTHSFRYPDNTAPQPPQPPAEGIEKDTPTRPSPEPDQLASDLQAMHIDDQENTDSLMPVQDDFKDFRNASPSEITARHLEEVIAMRSAGFANYRNNYGRLV